MDGRSDSEDERGRNRRISRADAFEEVRAPVRPLARDRSYRSRRRSGHEVTIRTRHDHRRVGEEAVEAAAARGTDCRRVCRHRPRGDAGRPVVMMWGRVRDIGRCRIGLGHVAVARVVARRGCRLVRGHRRGDSLAEHQAHRGNGGRQHNGRTHRRARQLAQTPHGRMVAHGVFRASQQGRRHITGVVDAACGPSYGSAYASSSPPSTPLTASTMYCLPSI